MSQNLWYITGKQRCLHGYIDEAKIAILKVDTALYVQVYVVIIASSWETVKQLNPLTNHLLSTYMGLSHLIK